MAMTKKIILFLFVVLGSILLFYDLKRVDSHPILLISIWLNVILPVFLYLRKYNHFCFFLTILGALVSVPYIVNYGSGENLFFNGLFHFLFPFFLAMPGVMIYGLVLAIKRYRDKEYKNEEGYRFLRLYWIAWMFLVVFLPIVRFASFERYLEKENGVVEVIGPRNMQEFLGLDD